MANDLNTLFIRLEADTARLKRGMQRADKITTSTMTKIRRQVKKASRAFKNLGSSLVGLAKKMSLIGLVGLAGLTILIKKSLDSIDNIGKLSKTLGIATKDLATFELAAKIGGSSLETFAKASRNVSKNVFDFVTRGVGEAVDSFKALGITANDLSPIINDTVKVMGLIADKLNELPDGAVKTAIAMKLLGGRAVELLPALAGGSKQLEKFREEAELLGIAMSTKAVAGVEAANDSITRLSLFFRGARDQIVAGLAPALETLIDLIRNNFLDALKENGLTVETWAQGIVIRVLDMVGSVLKSIQTLINSTKGIISNLKAGLQKVGLLEITDQERVLGLLDKRKKKQNELFNEIEKRQKILDESRKKFGSKVQDVGLQELKAQFIEITAGIEDIETTLKRAGITADKEGPFSDAALQKALAFLEKLKKKTKESLGGKPTEGGAPDKPLTDVGDALSRTNDKLATFFEDSKDGFSQWQDAGLNAVKSFEDALVNFVSTGKLSFKSLINGMIADIARLTIRKSITGRIASFLSKAISGKAGGGNISGPTLVGERGPELFIPKTAGTIRTAADTRGMMGRGPTSITQHITVATDVKNTVRAEMFQLFPILEQQLLNSINQQFAGVKA